MRWTCKRIELFIEEYLEGELSARDSFTYEVHLEKCPSCRKYLQSMSAYIEHVRQVGTNLPAPDRIPQILLDHVARLPLRDQFLLGERVREVLQEEEQKRRERMEKARKRRDRTNLN
jgi:predicted anti-sigma-YlaC factor YlaD